MKLFWKIFIAVFISFVFIIFIISYITSSKQISNEEKHIIDENRIFGNFISKEIELGYRESEWPFESLIKLTERKDFLFWWVVRDDGTIHLADKVSFMGTYAYDYFPQISNIKRRDVFLNREQSYGIYVESLEMGEKKWLFWLSFSLEEITGKKKEIILFAIIMSLVAMGILGITLYVLITYLTKPIIKLRDTAIKIEKGELDTGVQVKTKDEIGRLALSFDKMVRSLVEARKFPESIISSMADSLIVVTPKAKIKEVNQATLDLLGYKRKELIGQPIEKIFGRTTTTTTTTTAKTVFKRAGLEKLMKRGTIKDKRLTFQTKSGKKIPVSVSGSVVKSEKGELEYIIVIAKDMREILRLEREKRKTKIAAVEKEIKNLRELDRLKDDFLNIAAHELRTPLTSIIGLSEIIKMEESSLGSQYRKYIDIIHREGRRLSHIIKRMLTVTRFESGKETVHSKSFNLASFISSLMPNLEILAKKKKSKVVTKIEEKNIVIRSDREKITEVIYNLVDNAVKYGPKGQTITISITKPKRGWVKVEVKDQGPGIPPSLQKRLFTKLSQLEPSLSRTQEGTGLGLYICKLIVKKLGGKIGVKSALGKGSTFYFTLPIASSK